MRIRLYEKFKAWRRGEKMIPGVNRGRCFTGGNDLPAGGVVKIRKIPKIKLVGITVIRANGDIEDHSKEIK